MDLNELTPELFEKAEFAERRRGYDIDQVERFLEETGTAVAQLLVRHRQLEERAAHAESQVAEVQRQLGEAREQPAPARSAASEAEEAEEIQRATSTLLMAKRTADATIGEAEAEAAQIRGEATAGAEAIVTEARSEAEAELVAGRDRVLTVVTALEERRDALGAVVDGFEQRIGVYREQLGEVAAALASMTEDPDALASRPAVPVPEIAAGYVAGDEPAIADPNPAGASPRAPEAVDLTDATQIHDTATAAREDAKVAPGSWSDTASSQPDSTARPTGDRAEAPTPAVEASVREPSVIVDAEPVTGQTSDRFLRELDEAVNDSQDHAEESEEAMAAFFEGNEEEQGRSRFGWRR